MALLLLNIEVDGRKGDKEGEGEKSNCNTIGNLKPDLFPFIYMNVLPLLKKKKEKKKRIHYKAKISFLSSALEMAIVLRCTGFKSFSLHFY